MPTGVVVCHDFDGNLVDSMPLHGECAARCINQHFGIPVKKAERRYHETTGVPFDRQLETMFPDADHQKRQECALEYHRRKLTEVYDEVKLFPDVTEIVKLIHSAGFPQFICTSTETALTASVLTRCNLLVPFDAIWGKEFGNKTEHIKRASQQFNFDFVIFTGDSASDVVLSELTRGQFKVVTVGRTGTGKGMLSRKQLLDAGATFVIDTFTGLNDVIDNLFGPPGPPEPIEKFIKRVKEENR